MKSRTLLRTFGAAILCVSPVAAADPVIVPAGGPGCPPPPCATPSLPYSLPGSQAPSIQPPGAQQPGTAPAPSTDAFAQAPPTGGEGAQSALPNMIGDLGIYGVAPRLSGFSSVGNSGLTIAQLNQRLNLSPVFPTPGYNGLYFDLNNSARYTAAQLNAMTNQSPFSSNSISSNSSSSLSNRVPVTSFGAFKISDNESAAPVDRAFLTYNYYDVDGFHGNSGSLNREGFGFEKTFFDGLASFGVRGAVTEDGQGLGGTSDFDSLSFIFKYAFYMNRETGNVISGGLVVSVPTGPDIVVAPGSTINPTLLQPYLGYAFNFGRFYVQGFTEIIVPTDNTLSTFVANDIGLGYRLESVPVIPTIEIHSNDALNHQGSAGTPLGFVDGVTITGGFHTLIGNSILTLGVATPITGPRLYGVEAVAEFNWRF
jgi:hypothetical protein